MLRIFEIPSYTSQSYPWIYSSKTLSCCCKLTANDSLQTFLNCRSLKQHQQSSDPLKLAQGAVSGWEGGVMGCDQRRNWEASGRDGRIQEQSQSMDLISSFKILPATFFFLDKMAGLCPKKPIEDRAAHQKAYFYLPPAGYLIAPHSQ